MFSEEAKRQEKERRMKDHELMKNRYEAHINDDRLDETQKRWHKNDGTFVKKADEIRLNHENPWGKACEGEVDEAKERHQWIHELIYVEAGISDWNTHLLSEAYKKKGKNKDVIAILDKADKDYVEEVRKIKETITDHDSDEYFDRQIVAYESWNNMVRTTIDEYKGA